MGSGIPGYTGWIGTVLGTPDPVGLSRFYAALVGGDVDERDGTFVTLHRSGTTYLAFQLEVDHTPPEWPAGPGDQQMQVHLDVGVSSVPEAVTDAQALGARLAGFQPQDDVRVMLDPAGHPFCLYLDRG
ncbi:VOC family protein [Nocardioides sp. GXQ0305]|uniref:VOC family protein n=1 Tax=Nocardioides sp. GXQ0305 TaxID=3423912 RepID=UPI003D7CAB53